jgi:phi LC3 family holin
MINWKVRISNPVFWVQIASSIVVPIMAYLGLSREDMTSWAAFGGIFVEAVKNPVILAAVAVSVWNAINDPTTKGLADSDRAMTYTEPN